MAEAWKESLKRIKRGEERERELSREQDKAWLEPIRCGRAEVDQTLWCYAALLKNRGYGPLAKKVEQHRDEVFYLVARLLSSHGEEK